MYHLDAAGCCSRNLSQFDRILNELPRQPRQLIRGRSIDTVCSWQSREDPREAQSLS